MPIGRISGGSRLTEGPFSDPEPASHLSFFPLYPPPTDDRDGKYKKLTPDLYGPIIEEAHKRGLRVTAHIFTLDDAKGLLRADIDAFAHGVRDRDIDDEGLALFKKRTNVVVVPNLPDRGVKTDVTWLRDSLSEAEFKKLQAGAIDRSELQAPFGRCEPVVFSDPTPVVATKGRSPASIIAGRERQNQAILIAIGCAPFHSVRCPSSRRCSIPETIVRK